MNEDWFQKTIPQIASQSLQRFLLTIVCMIQGIEKSAGASDHPVLDRLIEQLRRAPRDDPAVFDDFQLVADYLEKNRDFSLFDFFDDPSGPPKRMGL